MDTTTPAWESLETYIANYTGRTKVLRLIHIAESIGSLSIQAYELALEVLRADSLDSSTYLKIVEKLTTSQGTIAHDYDTVWAQDASKKAQAITDKLEQELKAYKNNLIKESIRMGQQDIANHHARMGNMEDALRSLVRNRDYCTTPVHILQINMNIVNTSILLGQWAQVQTYVNKFETSSSQVKDKAVYQNQIYTATALTYLSQARYLEAAEKFLEIDSSIDTTYNNVISMNDIANITCLLALATFSRADILNLIESAAFKPFLELEICAREALTAYYRCRYSECLNLIGQLRTNMIADIYFSVHVPTIFSLIKERSLLQFISAFNVLPLSRISDAFSKSTNEIEKDLAELLSNNKLHNARLDLRHGLVVSEYRDARELAYSRSALMSEEYARDIERTLLHLNVASSALLVERASVRTSSET